LLLRGFIQEACAKPPAALKVYSAAVLCPSDEDEKEALLFANWETIAKHLAFTRITQFKKFARVEQHIIGAEIKHSKEIDLRVFAPG